MKELLLKSGTLSKKAKNKTEYARQTGALQSIETDYQLIEQDEVCFLVRSLSNVVRKEKAKIEQAKQEKKVGKYIDPFLPYEEDLFVTDISDTHLCLLNKFNVVDQHLLIVTRDFQDQQDLLNLNDFIALSACMQEVDGLAFYNGGKEAGASQRHKHLQLVPLPFLPSLDLLPIQPAIDKVMFNNSIGVVSSFPFTNAIASLDFTEVDNPFNGGKLMLDCYFSLLEKVGFTINQETLKQPAPYNFLATKHWMMIVPRSQESLQSISVNSLGFAGSLFVRDQDSLKLLQELTPMTVLKAVSC